MKCISIVLASEQRTVNPPSWAPAFRLIFINQDFQETRPFYATDSKLTFGTKEESDSRAEEAAKQWCADNYPDWPITRN
jgi:hypothetical protein